MALTNWQEFVSNRFPGKGAQPNQQQLEQLAQEFFGNIALPAGVDESQVTSRTGGYVEYKDAEGYVHRLTRDLDGRSPNAGQVREGESTNRPAILPPSKEQQEARRSLEGVATSLFQRRADAVPGDSGIAPWQARLNQAIDQLMQQSSLAQVDPQTQQSLIAIKAAGDAQRQQQFQEGQSDLVARLFGTGINKSSIAGSQAARLLQEQGLVQQQANADAAQRELQIRQFLTQTGQGNLALATQSILGGGNLALEEFAQKNNMSLQEAAQFLSYLTNLQNQDLSREVSGGQLGLEGRKLNQQQSQFDQQMQQQYLMYQEQQRQAERAATWNNIFKGISAVTGVGASLAGGGGLNSLFSGIFGGGANTPAPNVIPNFNPPYNPSLPTYIPR